MKPLRVAWLALGLAMAIPANAQEAAPGLLPASAVAAEQNRLTMQELKDLVGPIALYPDPLVALILPASTYPNEIVLAARFVASAENPSLVDDKPWDVSVRGMVRYPDVLKWMDENLEWTTQLGNAYLVQPDDVMAAIQELRAQAQQVGSLVDTPQQKVVRETSYVRIVPADPEYIYVPYYDPGVVYYEPAPIVHYSEPWVTGWWLCFDFDWHRHRLYCGDWYGDYDYDHHHHDHRYDYRGDRIFINNNLTNVTVWEGDSRRRDASLRALRDFRTTDRVIDRPARFREQPEFAREARRAIRENALAERQRDRSDPVNAALTEARLRGRDRNRAQRPEDEVASKLAGRNVRGPESDKLNRNRIEDIVKGRNRDGRDAATKSRTDIANALPRDKSPTAGTVGPDGKLRGSKGDVAGELGRDGKRGGDRSPGVTGRPDIKDALPKSKAPDVGAVGPDGKGRGTKGDLALDVARSGKRDAERGPGASGRPDIKSILPKDRAPSVGAVGPDAKVRGPKSDMPRDDVRDLRRDAPSSPGSKGKDLKRDATPNVAASTPQPAPRVNVPKAKAPEVKRNDASPAVAKRDNIPKASPAVRDATPKSSPAIRRDDAPKPKSVARSSPPKPSVASAPAVRKSAPKPQPTVRKSAPKPQPAVRKSSPKPSAPAVRKSSPKPQPTVRKSAPKPQPTARKSSPKPRPSVSAPRPSKPAAVKRPSAPKAKAAPSGGGGGKKDTKKKK